MKKAISYGLAGLFLAAAASLGIAQIKRLTLTEMVGISDKAVQGQIVGSRVFKVDHPTDGADLYYTTITLQGKALDDDTTTTVDVTFRGGFIGDEGVYNSEAPAADDVKLGNEVVAFYRYTDDMGGGVAANALCAAHGGIYRTAQGPSGTMVLGRGDGYAIAANTKLESLATSIKSIRAQAKKK